MPNVVTIDLDRPLIPAYRPIFGKKVNKLLALLRKTPELEGRLR
jgi:hypothetical protein